MYALMRLALLMSAKHRSRRIYGWHLVVVASPNQLGLVNLDGTVVAPRPFRDWRGKPNAGGERRR